MGLLGRIMLTQASTQTSESASASKTDRGRQMCAEKDEKHIEVCGGR